MSNYDSVRNDLKVLAEKIEALAGQVKDKLEANNDVNDLFVVANEMVRNSSVFTFALGEVVGMEQTKSQKKVKVVKNPNATPRFYKRDAYGRFAKV